MVTPFFIRIFTTLKLKIYKVMQVLRFFTDELSGDECAIVWNGTEEICVTADEAWDIEAQAQARQDAYELRGERGW